MSGLDHTANGSEESVRDARWRAGIRDDVEFPADRNVTFPMWLTTRAMEGQGDGFPMGEPGAQRILATEHLGARLKAWLEDGRTAGGDAKDD